MSKKFMKLFRRKTSDKILIFGLGNPGEKYELTRHNIGRMVLDNLLEKYGEVFDEKSRFKSEIAEIEIAQKEIILAKSLIYMNESGYSLRLIKDYYGIIPENIWVIHDDIDIAFGKIKTSFGQGAAGHHGVESVIEHLGTKDFNRLRIGIWNEDSEEKNKEITQNYVLDRFTQKEEKELINIKKNAISFIETAF
jgi:PTH1 family peptidyl-tRNA hydrolase